MAGNASTLSRPDRNLVLAACLTVAAGTLWAYWSTLAEAAERWARDPQYSHGYLVPVFAAVLLWLRRQQLPAAWPPWSIWGIPVLAAGIGMRLFAAYYHYVWLDPISLLPCLAGVCLLLGGWATFRWAWPAIAFLAFMIPLPHRVAVAASGTLQRIATVASTFVLQLLGLPALAEGNTILIDEIELGVVEACSGLRMLVIFFALSTGVALLIQRRLWEKLVIVISAVPIALVSNILRITATGILHRSAGSDFANLFFHDLAGWVMMPLALGFLWIELKVLDRLLINPTQATPPRPAPTPPRGGGTAVEGRPSSRRARYPAHTRLRPAHGA